MTIKDRVKTLCTERGISVQFLEGELGFGSGTISRWDDKMPNVDRVMKVARYFDVSVDYLLGTAEEPQPDSVDEALEQLHKNPELRTLLSASANLSKEDIAFVTELVSRMKNQK